MKRFIKYITLIISVFAFVIFGMITYANNAISDIMSAKALSEFESEMLISYVTKPQSAKAVSRDNGSSGSYNVVFKLFGVFPVKEASVSVGDRSYVNVLGSPFGIKLYTDGVLIVNMTSFPTDHGTVCPAEEGGLKSGDYIISINDVNVFTNSQVGKIVETTGRKPLEVVYCRNNTVYKTTVQPTISCEDGKYHLGMWVRDSSAGVGTLTFYDPTTGVVAGLGHALCDSDTGKMISVNKGSIVEAEILSIAKSSKGLAGELLGRFKENEYSNSLTNSQNGIYSKTKEAFSGFGTYPVSYNFEIEEGSAEILTTVNGTDPELYECEVIKVFSSETNSKNFVVKVTDSKLTSKTGGIVQGMSGSPIIQNGKLIGAVTHVLVDDPTKGYGIFAENMLETAQIVAKENLKDAS